MTYAFITIPKQKLKSNEGIIRKNTFFVFQINEGVNVSLKMIPNLLFMFSGAMLTHQQHCDEINDRSAQKDIQPFLILHLMETKNCFTIYINRLIEI